MSQLQLAASFCCICPLSLAVTTLLISQKQYVVDVLKWHNLILLDRWKLSISFNTIQLFQNWVTQLWLS